MNLNNRNHAKHLFKTSYRINDNIKSFIDKTNRDVRKETGLDISMGRIARAFWTALAEDRKLRKKTMDYVCKIILRDKFSRENIDGKKNRHR